MKTIIVTIIKRQFLSISFFAAIISISVMMVFLPKMLNATGGLHYMGAIMSTGIVLTTVLAWGSSTSAVKNSSIMTSIRTASIGKIQFFLITLIPGMIMFIVALLIFFSVCMALIHSEYFEAYNGVTGNGTWLPDSPDFVKYTPSQVMSLINWGQFIGGMVLAFVAATCTSIAITSLSTSETQSLVISWVYSMGVLFFTGAGAPVVLVRKPLYDTDLNAGESSLQVFQFIGFIFPNSFTNYLVSDGLGASNLEALDVVKAEETFLVNVIVPIGYSIGLLGLSGWGMRYWR